MNDSSRVLDLIPAMMDPKNLYGMGMARAVQSGAGAGSPIPADVAGFDIEQRTPA
jgi:hypothetical protein